MTDTKYVLITPAKNEEDFIEKTLASVVAQTVLPEKWVIVSDGSTDRTDEIVSRFQQHHPFIQLVRRDSQQHCFGSKVHAFRAGYDELQDQPYDFIGNLDADIELPQDYYEQLMNRFASDAKLGLAGGTRCDLQDGKFVEIRFNSLSIGGAYQFFRRACFEEIGGYMPLEMGGIDTVAGIMARQRGWRVRAFDDLVAKHYRPTGTAQGSQARLGFRTGKKDYLMGYHPLFECFRMMRVSRPKDVLHNICGIVGFMFAALRRYPRQVPPDMVQFLRAEQLGRLKQVFLRFHDPAAGRREHRSIVHSREPVES